MQNPRRLQENLLDTKSLYFFPIFDNCFITMIFVLVVPESVVEGSDANHVSFLLTVLLVTNKLKNCFLCSSQTFFLTPNQPDKTLPTLLLFLTLLCCSINKQMAEACCLSSKVPNKNKTMIANLSFWTQTIKRTYVCKFNL